MPKVITMTGIVLGTIILMSLVFPDLGLNSSQLYNAIRFGDLQNFKIGNIFGLLFGSVSGLLAIGAGTSAIIIGYLATKEPLYALKAGFISTVGGWLIGDMIMLFVKLNSVLTGSFEWIATVIQVFIAVLIAMTIFSLIQWWEGSDA